MGGECNAYTSEPECIDMKFATSSAGCIWDNEECVSVEPFGDSLNGFELNKTCMNLIVIFLFLFFYKEDIMKKIYLLLLGARILQYSPNTMTSSSPQYDDSDHNTMTRTRPRNRSETGRDLRRNQSTNRPPGREPLCGRNHSHAQNPEVNSQTTST